MLRTFALGLSAALLALGFGGAAQASLLGQTVSCSNISPGGALACSTPTATVTDGGGPEFQIETGSGSPFFEIDVSGESVLMSAVSSIRGVGGTASVTLGDLIWGNDPGATITGITNFVISGEIQPLGGIGDGLIESDVTFTANAVTIDYSNTAWSPGSFLSFDLVTTHSQLPEPATLALFGLGIAGLGLMARRRKAA